MPFDSEGNFSRVYNWENDRQNDVNIMSDRQDIEDDNFAEGLSQCLLRSGIVPMSGDLKLGSFQIKNLADGTAANDAVNKSQFDALNTTLRNFIATSISDTLANLYPVGSIYIGTQTTCPLASLISGSQWEIVATDRALWGGDGSNANSTIEAGLPNITGTFQDGNEYGSSDQLSGAFYRTDLPGHTPYDGNGYPKRAGFDASRSNEIYGRSSTVQPPAYRVNIWRRTA